MAKQSDFAYYLTTYLTSYLSGEKNFSLNTIRSYRDSFKLLLQYCGEKLNIPPGKIQFQTLNVDVISGFIEWLKKERGNSVGTANQRLAAIHAFFKYLQKREPAQLLLCRQILAIDFATVPKPMIGFLDTAALQCVFAEANEGTRNGRRDLALLHLLYDSGARVQEICDMRVRDVLLSDNPYVRLTGKGKKTRYAPIVNNVAKRLSDYIAENGLTAEVHFDMPLFFNQRRQKLTRAGVSYIVAKYADSARLKSPRIPPNVTPHIFRHTKAMHLCMAGVDIIYIRDILGHVDLATTEVYAKLRTRPNRQA